MQINIDKKTGALLGIIIVLIAIIGLGMARNGDNRLFGMHGHEMMDSDKAERTMDLSGADVMFLQMMIPHHQQAVDISNLAISKSKDSELIALATNIRDGQSAEIIQMKSWLAQADADMDMGHSMGDSMGGMLSEDELATLESASEKDFNLLWLQGMTNHHDGALHMSEMIEDATNLEIESFGKNIVSTQSAQIEQMKLMIKRLSNS